MEQAKKEHRNPTLTLGPITSPVLLLLLNTGNRRAILLRDKLALAFQWGLGAPSRTTNCVDVDLKLILRCPVTVGAPTGHTQGYGSR